MDLIYQNPFRVLGLPVTATDREIVKCISDLSIFMEMGKTKELDCDYFFPIKPYRTLESIYDASQKIEQPNNKLFYALFWFWENPTNTIDEMAFEELRKGNVDKAIQFWKKATENGVTTKNSSNHKNLSVLYLGLSFENGKLNKAMFLKSVSLSGRFLSNNHFEEFMKLIIGSKHSIDPLEIINSYVDEIISLAKPHLDKNGGLKTKELIKSFVSYPNEIKNVILDKFIGKYIRNIERQIKIAESRREENVIDANKIGFELLKKTIEDLKYLNSVLSKSDLEYQLIADKLAEEIVQCSICYFNRFRDTELDPGDDALKLAQFAKRIAVGERINKRIDEGMPIIQKYVDDKPKRIKLKPVKKEIDCIYEELENLPSPGSISHYTYPIVAKKFLFNCEKQLEVIKNTLGRTDNDYLQICDLVINNALGICTFYLNTMAKTSEVLIGEKKRRYLIEAFVRVRPLFDTIGRLDMTSTTRQRYIELCTSLGLISTSAKSLSGETSQKVSTGGSVNKVPESSGNCYIATMVYGSYNSPEVRVLRRFRDETLKQSEIGRKFIQIYYKYSPLLANKTKNIKVIHFIFKLFLNRLVTYLRAKYE
jgi:hypothetical protein